MSDEISNAGFRIERYPSPESMPTEYACRLIRLPHDPRIFAAVSDVLVYLAMPGVWEESENVTDEQMQYLMSEMFYEFSQPLECSAMVIPTGTIQMYVGAVAPDGWLLCNGDGGYSKTAYPELWTVLSQWGSFFDLGTDFSVPDLRQRSPIGYDPASINVYDVMGDHFGSKTETLTTAQMPSHTHVQDAHNHTQQAHNHVQNSHNHTQQAHGHGQHNHAVDVRVENGGGVSGTPAVAYNIGGATTQLGTTQTTPTNATAVNNATTATNQAATAVNNATTATNQSAGGGQSHNNLHPVCIVNFIIKT